MASLIAEPARMPVAGVVTKQEEIAAHIHASSSRNACAAAAHTHSIMWPQLRCGVHAGGQLCAFELRRWPEVARTFVLCCSARL